MLMETYEPVVVRWGLHFLDICSISNGGAPESVTYYDKDISGVEYVREGFCEIEHISVENDEVIAHALQEELSHGADADAFGSSNTGYEQQKAILPQDWPYSSKRHDNFGNENSQEEEGERGNGNSCSTEEKSDHGDVQSCSPEISDESNLDCKVGKSLNQMVPVPHIPKINGEVPTVDEETLDHQRLMDRLQLYDLVELKVLGDGNCQFRSLSDQIYRTTKHHEFVREQIVDQLKSHRELYEGYVPMAFDDYLKKASKLGEWGDHVTLQAAADSFGIKIFVITSFKDTCYIEILPHIQKSNRIICLSFWAEVHYNSIYPQGDPPKLETKKTKSWWNHGS